MIAWLDTNVLIRHVTGDPPDQAAQATRLLSRASTLYVPDLILAETVYVLESFYEVDRLTIANLCRSIVGFPSIVVSDELLLLRAIAVYELHRIDFQDAYLIASAERSGVGAVASFDHDVERTRTVRRIDPGSG